MSERIIYEASVPLSERQAMDDTPEAYRVVTDPELPTCMVYGLYSRNRPQPEWVANPSCRWLVKHLIGRLNEFVELKEWRDSMTDNCGQTTIRQRLADATRDELLEIIVQRDGRGASGFDWYEQYAAADHRVRRLESLLASRYHTEGLDRALHVADLEAKNRKLREEIRMMQLAAERHNQDIYATGLIVHCTGCEAGAPFNAAELTEERVRAVEEIAARLRTWWNNHAAREARQSCRT